MFTLIRSQWIGIRCQDFSVCIHDGTEEIRVYPFYGKRGSSHIFCKISR
ncbi:hypothetical protein LEP1GSC193_1463 [Leptospira alstonii serovar Pingchang str. 80-412]|uniref:Uncharacterized protein n=1 Tax=Leptospira alstonii serovar Pingchang str. 80-412 TaxID=1218564 RepID=T0HDM7_9LEPT|nr:hypothetical protein LEP1GSC193_1463 [Leptospira alstonii serovar Pingchang str. 80-412]